jgi:hypothetical protein
MLGNIALILNGHYQEAITKQFIHWMLGYIAHYVEPFLIDFGEVEKNEVLDLYRMLFFEKVYL